MLLNLVARSWILDDKFSKDVFRNTNKSAIGALTTSGSPGKVFLFHTENLSLYLAQFHTNVKNKKHSNIDLYKDRNKLKLVILETSFGDDPKWDMHYWYTHYKSLGYTFYNDDPPITIIPIISVTTKGILVQLRNRAYNRFTIGVFSTIQEAEEFVDHFHKNSIAPVWACNDLTIKYFNP